MARQRQPNRAFALVVLLWVQVQSSFAFDVTSYLSKYKLEPADEHEDGGEPDAIACPISCHNGGTCAWGAADYSMFPAADTSGGVDVSFKFLTQTSRLGRHCSCPWGSTGLRCSVPYEMERSNTTTAVHVCFHGGTIIEGLSDAIDADQQFCDCSTATFRGRNYVGKYCELTEREAEKEGASNLSSPCNLDCGPGECKVAFADAQSGASDSIKVNEKLRVPQTQEISTTLSHTYCQCPEQFSGELCEIDLTSATVVAEDIDEHLPRDDPECNLDCGLGYCQKGGMMQQQSASNYTQAYENSNGEDFMVCICPQNSFGQHCEVADSSNDGSSSDEDWFCLDGGVVKTDTENNNKPYCYCKQGFEGDHCEYKHGQVPTCDIDCGGHGTCSLGVNKYISNITQNDPELESALQYFKNEDFQHCKCDEGWAGGTCDLKVDLCGEDRHICLHGSTCLQQSDNSYRCDCRDAYTAESRYAGQYCQHHHTEGTFSI